MKIYGVSKTGYGWIFALLSVAFIGSSQLNSFILKWFSSKKIVTWALLAQCIFSVIFLIFAFNDWLNLYLTLTFIALFLSCLGFINPNAAALALAPFSKNAGSASALMGALQMGLGALASVMVSLFSKNSVIPMPLVMTAAALIAMVCLLLGRKLIKTEVEASPDAAIAAH